MGNGKNGTAMSPNRLFIDPESNELDLDVDRLLFEAKPIALILLVFGGAGVVLFVFAQLFRYVGLFHQLFLFAQQFAFTLGGFVALLYVLVRAMQFADGDGLEVGSGTSPSAGTQTGGESAQSRYEVPVTDKNRTSSTEVADEAPSDGDDDGHDTLEESGDADDTFDDNDDTRGENGDGSEDLDADNQ